jgi:UDP-3-O-[3-hydroxymyristoyl] N-acetylglucosamine deacetylase/3-hydroxyacyl-[acyl-carrier-protein] dehydratase
MKQKTIKKKISLNGVGLHTGIMIQMNILPAEVKHGVKFKRVDLEGQPVIPADVSYVTGTNRGTILERGGHQVRTVEHLLSALSGLEVDNVLVEINGPEVPILDGSAKKFVDAIMEVGLEEQESEREYLVIDEPIHFEDERTGSIYTALPSDKLEITSLVDFSGTPIDQQFASISDFSQYADEIAPCRTFVLASELEQLVKHGLVKGGDLKNALVIVDIDLTKKQINDLSGLFGVTDIRIEGNSVLKNVQPQFINEPARHKLLDVIGDLSLMGKPIIGKIIVNRPGHTSNVQFAKLLKQKYLVQKRLKGKPKYDPNADPIMDLESVKKLLPHRYPFLFVDKIIELSEKQVVGVKNVTFNEQFFQGHFPGNPIFPGVLQMEALAQTGGILALTNVKMPDEWDTYFLKMENVRFKQKVVPGDTLILKMELLSPIRRGIVHMQGTAYVGNKIVSEGELTAQIVHVSPDA